MSRTRLAASLVLAAVLIGAGYKLWKKPSERGQRSRTVAVTQGPISATIETSGSITPHNRIEVKPPISGRIDKLLVNEGDSVKEGQILAWMSSSDRAAILDAARAVGSEEMKRWEDSYKPTPIIAPLTGVVILRNVVQGQTVEQGTVLYAISDSLIVTAQVDESDIGQVKENMPVRIVLDSYPARPVDGAVFDILYEGKNVSNVITYGVKIRPLKAQAFFRSQMTASVSFITGKKEDALILPLSAIREAPGGGKRVMVPGADGKPPEPRDIVVGMESGEQVEIVSGLKAGDLVVVGSGRYVPQQGPASSPLTMGGRGMNQGGPGRAPRPKRTP